MGVGDLRMLIKKSEHSIVDFSLTLAPITLRIHQRPLFFLTLKTFTLIGLSANSDRS